jgi:putative transposase
MVPHPAPRPGRPGLWDGNSWRVPQRCPEGDASGMLDLLLLTLAALRAACRARGDLVLENLLLRHQLTVLTRRPRVRFRRLDELLWVLARRLRHDWRRHLVLVRPDAVVRWHRDGWRLYWRWRSRSAGGGPRLSPAQRCGR